jgi:integral membrane sensor domain MASE1
MMRENRLQLPVPFNYLLLLPVLFAAAAAATACCQ